MTDPAPDLLPEVAAEIAGEVTARPRRFGDSELDYQRALQRVLTRKVFRQICESLVAKCLEGEVPALRLLFEQVLPKRWREYLTEAESERFRVIEGKLSTDFLRLLEAGLRAQKRGPTDTRLVDGS